MMQAWLKKANPGLAADDSAPAAAGGDKLNQPTKRSADAAGADAGSAPGTPKRARTAADRYASKPVPKDGPPYLALERQSMHRTWYWRLAGEFEKPYFIKLKEFIEAEYKSQRIFPQKQDIYTWAKTPFSKVKVVILGQDPYHGPNQAHGLSFSVLPPTPPPPSLVNIYQELASDVGMARPKHGHLIGWARQGVLLLNAVLTVRQGQANSHAKRGWEEFTDAVVKAVDREADRVVFILWGSHAQKKGAGISRSKHLVLKAPHPSPLSAHRGFFGSKPFSQANTWLRKHGVPEVDWTRLPEADDEEAEQEEEEPAAKDDADSEAKSTSVEGPAADGEVSKAGSSGGNKNGAGIDADEEQRVLQELAANQLLEDW